MKGKITNFDSITESPERLTEFLCSLPVIEGPWDEYFHKKYCKQCDLEECTQCKHGDQKERIAEWLTERKEM